MPDLILSEESKQYQDLARDFFENEVANKSESLDHSAQFPIDLYKACWDLGLATAILPEEYGGLGLGLWDSAVMAEEAGKASGGFSAILEGNVAGLAPLLVAGSAEQKSKYLNAFTSTPQLVGFICDMQSELMASDMPAISYKETSNGYEVNSHRQLCALNGENGEWFTFSASDSETGKESVFIVEANSDGVKRGEQIYKLGRRCADVCSLELSSVKLSEAQLIGEIGQAQPIMQKAFVISNTIEAAHATGIIASALQNSIRYSKERITFGKPISNHQAVSFMLADMAKGAQASRLLCWKSAWLFDQGHADYIQARAAKAFAVDAAMAAATDAVQIYGGYGYSKEYPVERLMRDAKVMQMFGKSSFDMKVELGEMLLASAK